MAFGLRWSQEEYEAYAARLGRVAVSLADLEQSIEHAAKAKDAGKKNNPRFCLRIHSRRRRLCDADGISAKAAIDGLVAGGILPDDSATYLESVSYSQEKTSGLEETIIELFLISEE